MGRRSNLRTRATVQPPARAGLLGDSRIYDSDALSGSHVIAGAAVAVSSLGSTWGVRWR